MVDSMQFAVQFGVDLRLSVAHTVDGAFNYYVRGKMGGRGDTYGPLLTFLVKHTAAFSS